MASRTRFTTRAAPLRALERVDGLLAGAAEVDITPPPGMPKAGYSANAHLGNGFRTRLRARIVHLRAGTTSLALVQCDLLGGSAVLQHQVATAIGAHTDVPLAGLFIGATHTHAGPGQFLGSDFYNRFASNRSGFDPAWAAFLVDQIAGGVLRAVDGRRPARAAFGTAEVFGATRNRSLAPHVRNTEVLDKRTEPQRKYAAINPSLHLLRVDTDEGPLATAIVFSVHGTGVSMHAHEYNADVWAYLCREAGDRIEAASGTRPVVGAMEGTHADVAPAIRPGLAGHLEAARVGRIVGAAAANLHASLDTQLRRDLELSCGLREVDLHVSREIDGVTLPRRAAIGAALVAGAHENTTPVIHRIPPFAPGRPRRARGTHGGKRVLGTRLFQPLVLPLRSFPHVLPFHVLRIDDTLIVGLSFELTVETGCRIEAAVWRALGDASGVRRVVMSSVANEYMGYATTPEEYALQHYEGGHTIYGDRTQPFLAAHASRLASEVVRANAPVQDVLAQRDFDLRSHRYLPDAPAGDTTWPRAFTGQPLFSDPTQTTDAQWSVQWRDAPPGALHWHEPMMRVEGSADGMAWDVVADDQAAAIQLAAVGTDDSGAHLYRATWWDPVLGTPRRHRFVLLANANRPEVLGAPFD